MIGSDTGVNGQWENYGHLIQINREWLKHLPRRETGMIAYKNAEKLFWFPVSKDLIGKL